MGGVVGGGGVGSGVVGWGEGPPSQTSAVHPTLASKLQPMLQHTPVSSSLVEHSRIPILSHFAAASEKDFVRKHSGSFGREQTRVFSISPAQQLTALSF